MIIDLSLIQTILLKLPLTHNQNNLKYSYYLKYKDCIKLWRTKQELKMRVTEPGRGLLMGSRSYPDSNDGFSEVGKLEKNELLDSGIDPLQIGYGVDGVGLGAPGTEFDFGDGHGGKGVGGYGKGGNDGQGHGGSEANDGLTGLELWWFWQQNHAIRTLKRRPTSAHFSCNDRHQVIGSAAEMLVQVLSPSDMTKARLVTKHAIEDIFSLLCEVMFLPLMIPLVQSHEYEVVIAGTLFMILGATVTLAAVVSGGVIYGLWHWRNSLQNHDSDDDDSDPQYSDPQVH
ncbi:uncharacterized protein LOC141596058 isoform X1 [Silene latifolia]|uniref:uncharacterized protein LOC141596058 isoform X1 n=1 Tax=Silene latifolia TaxID=37657 RepID=UPI003D788836